MSLDMFQLGLALGTGYGNMWAANADKRQSKKADKIIDDIKNQQEMEHIEALRQPTDMPSVGERAAADRLNSQTQGLDGNYTFELPSAAEQLRIRNPVQEAVERSNADGLNAIVANMAAKQGMSPAQQAQYTWNKGYTEKNVRDALSKAGIRQNIIDDKMKRVNADVAEQARAALLPQIQNYMYGQFVEADDGNGGKVIRYQAPSPADYGKALNGILELEKYDPDSAKKLMNGLVLPKDMYVQQGKERLAQQAYTNRKSLQNANFANQRALQSERLAAKQGAGGSGKGKNGGVSFSEYEKLLEIREELKNKRIENGKLDEDDVDTYNAVGRKIADYESGTAVSQQPGEAQQMPKVDKDDWNSVNAAVDTLIASGTPREEIIGALQEMYPPGHPWLENIISSMTHTQSQAAAKQPTAAEKQAALQAVLFPDGGAQGHTGLAAEWDKTSLRDWARRKDEEGRG